MKRTKFLALLTTSVLALSMSTAVFAEDTSAPVKVGSLEAGALGSTVKAEGKAKLPTIDVEMPTSHTFTINPYKIDSKTQIDSTVATIVNNSDTAIDVSLKSAAVTFKSTSKNLPVLATAKADIAKSTTKAMYFELQSVILDSTTKAADAKFDGAKVTPITSATKTTSLGTLNKKTDKETQAMYLKFDGETVVNPAAGWDTSDTATITSVYTFAVTTTPTV